MGSPLGHTIANVFFVIMKKFSFKIVLLNSYLLFTKGTLMMYSYFLARNVTSKNFELILIVSVETSDSLPRMKMKTPYHFLTLK